MDVSDYLPMFLAEAREHLQNLNLALVRIEQDPADGETVNEIFRIAHSMKGMSATMGFARMAALTHEMESVMEGLRGRSEPMEQTSLNALFQCLDTLESMTDEIEEEGAEQTDPTSLIATLKAIRTGEVAQAAVDDAAPVGPDADVVAGYEKEGLAVLRVELTLTEGVDMPGVRTFLAVRKLEEHGQVVDTLPDAQTIEQGEVDAEAPVIVWLAAAHDGEVLAGLFDAAEDGIAAVGVAPHVPGAAPKPAAPAKPAAKAEAAPAEPVATAAAAPAAPAAAAPAAGAPAAKEHGDHKNKQRSQTVRVEAERLDLLMHQMGELVVQRTRLEQIAQKAGVSELQQAVAELSRVAQALQQQVMQVRMVPVESVFMRFPRMVRDLAAKLDKHVDLRIKGEDTELDRTVVEALGDPLVHLVRNALDHGLERGDDREAAGKPSVGVLEISAEHAGGEVVIKVRDDGRGVNAGKVAQIAADRGLIGPEQVPHVTVDMAIQLLFEPGFSTAETTTDISGRGVGMDAVRTMVRNLGGDCSMTSVYGKGSEATIRLPLSLAILPALLVECDGAPYALPLERVEQTIRMTDYNVRSVAGAKAIVLRERILPVHDLGAMLGGAGVDVRESPAVVLHGRGERVGVVVDALIGQQELVTRPLPAVTDTQRALVSGGAVLGDGRIALIVDTDRLISMAKAA